MAISATMTVMKEIEVKIKISSPVSVMTALRNHGAIFSESVIQRDVVYIPQHVPTVPAPAGTNTLRIRRQGDESIADTTKIRVTCKLSGYEICIDHVNELGDYLEVEKMTGEDPMVVQEEMIAFLDRLGIDASQRVLVGYDVLFVHRKA